MTNNLDRETLKIAIREILIEDRELLRDIIKDLLEEEARILAKKQFKKYANVFKALA